MTVRVLFVAAQLRRTDTRCRIEKYRIVTKTTRSATFAQNESAPFACREYRLAAIGHHKARGAMKRRTAIFVGYIVELMQQFFDVRVVAGPDSCKARGEHSRATIESINHESGIIAYGRQPGSARCMPGLDQRVRGKRVARLIDITDTKIGLRHDSDVEIAKDVRDLAQLANVTAGHDDLARQLVHC